MKGLLHWWKAKHEPALYEGIGLSPMKLEKAALGQPSKDADLIGMMRGTVPIPR